MDSGRLFFDSVCHGNMLYLGSGDTVFRGSRSVMNMEETSKRRPFFSSPDELFDEDYYDEQLPEKKRRLSPEQVHLLEKSFEVENKLEPDRKTQLAKKLGMQPRQVAVWFQNRRARWKTKQLERDYDKLKASYDSLMSDYDSILNGNEKLKAEVLSLNEKLQAKEMAREATSEQKSDLLLAVAAHVPPLQFDVKVEDRLSTGSGRSAVVDDDGPHLVDSGDSYFPGSDDYPGCVGAVEVDRGVMSEEDDGSDDGRITYFIDVFVAEQQQHHEEEQPIGWWVWS
ncbi:hypothetical protein RJ639_003561 [Escallonia herrerae]|uniref:Homeobox-leucine zipper protein n=1 Tax=Escallonia herrerae TaxID=1293975 RepID=A0AA88W2S3_9ASTE|nr:hypothetical protein RJ639_003561 [Escallonia herrerae]